MEFAKAFFLYRLTQKACDALVWAGVWHLTWWVRFQSGWIPFPKGIPGETPYNDALLPLVLGHVVVFHVVGAYRRDRVAFGFRAIKKLVEGSVLGLLVFVSTLYFLEQTQFSRAYLLAYLALVLPALVSTRFLLHGVWTALRRLLRPTHLLLVGGGRLLDAYAHRLQHTPPYPIQWLGQLGAKPQSNVPFLGEEDRLVQTIRELDVDRVILSYPPDQQDRIPPSLALLSKELVEVKVLPDFGRDSSFTYHAEQECGFPLLSFNQPRIAVTDRFFKRTFDATASFIGLMVLSPLYGLLALGVKLSSPGPVFYSQERVGADGRVFRCYKFRSMVVDAESSTGPVWASEGDNRTTRIGSWMRRTNLDELPQLWNVVRGDMSLVGPRPERPVFVDQFKQKVPQYMQRHKMKSGLTGWAQVNGWRGNTSIEERIKHDLFYISHWSHLLDIKILVLTFVKGFRDKNAY